MQAKALLKGTDGAAKFEKKYGRNYIYGCIYGGWYHGVYSFDATSVSQKNEITAAVAGSFKGVRVEAKGSLTFKTNAEVSHQ